MFFRISIERQFEPPYKYLWIIEIDSSFESELKVEKLKLDTAKAIMIYEEDLPEFNNFIKLVNQYELTDYL